MPDLDFERYARQKTMTGEVAEKWIEIFEKCFISRFHKNELKNVKILDYGCGDGRYFEYFKNYFNVDNIFGVEVSKIRVERAKQKGWEKIFCVALDEPLPFSEDSFDFINWIEVIEHIPYHKADFYLREIKRVLKPNGILILTTPNYPWKRLYDFKDAIFHKKIKRFKDDSTHLCKYSLNKLKSLLKKYFKIDEITHYKSGVLYNKTGNLNFVHKILVVCVNEKTKNYNE